MAWIVVKPPESVINGGLTKNSMTLGLGGRAGQRGQGCILLGTLTPRAGLHKVKPVAWLLYERSV